MAESQITWQPSICPYCGVGYGLYLHIEDGYTDEGVCCLEGPSVWRQ